MTPDTYTIQESMIEVGDNHILYSQLWGNPDAAQTIIVLHGGPGSGCNDSYKSMFNPQTQRVVFFDQRGSGRSTPCGEIANNNTDALVEDISKVADHYKADSFIITGGSWGSTLALTYAIRNPKRIEAMVLRGIFTGRKKEIDFLDQGKFRDFFPDVWETYALSVPDEFRENPSDYHMPRITGNDPEAAKESAFAYATLEGGVATLDDRKAPQEFSTFDPAGTIIESTYLVNNCFIPEGHIFDNAKKLTMPIYLVQGRYDAICPPSTAYELSKVLPNSVLRWTTAGHSLNERANWDVVSSILASLTNS